MKFEVVTSSFEENLDKASFKFPYDYVKETATHKTLDVARRLACDSRVGQYVATWGYTHYNDYRHTGDNLM